MDTKYEIDGIEYSEGLPHSRIEKELLDILEKMDEEPSTSGD